MKYLHFFERSVCDKGSLIAAQTALEQDSFDANEFSITISTLFKTPTEAPAAADWQTASKTKLKLKPVRQNFTQFRFIFVMNLLKKVILRFDSVVKSLRNVTETLTL